MLINAVIRKTESKGLTELVKEAEGNILSESDWGKSSRFLLISIPDDFYTFLKLKYGESIWPR